MLDLEPIKNKFIEIARDGVGSYLSTTGTGLEQRAAVMRQRIDGIKPNYPYVTLDITSIEDESGWEIAKGIDDYDGTVFTETVKQLLITYRVYGSNNGQSVDSLFIANKLNGYLKLASVRDEVRDDLNGSIVQIFGVDSNPVLLVDRYLESASFNLIFNAVDRTNETDEGSGEIDTISLDPDLGDEDSLPDIVVEREESP